VTEPVMISHITLTTFDHSVSTCITISFTWKHIKEYNTAASHHTNAVSPCPQ